MAITGLQVSTVVLQTTLKRRPAMTDHKITPDAPVLVAIDIAKHRHEVLIEVLGVRLQKKTDVVFGVLYLSLPD